MFKPDTMFLVRVNRSRIFSTINKDPAKPASDIIKVINETLLTHGDKSRLIFPFCQLKRATRQQRLRLQASQASPIRALPHKVSMQHILYRIEGECLIQLPLQPHLRLLRPSRSPSSKLRPHAY